MAQFLMLWNPTFLHTLSLHLCFKSLRLIFTRQIYISTRLSPSFMQQLRQCNRDVLQYKMNRRLNTVFQRRNEFHRFDEIQILETVFLVRL